MKTVFLKLCTVVLSVLGGIKSLCVRLISLWKRACRRFPRLRRSAATAASVVLTVVILCSIFSKAGLTYALEVTVNGTNYGFVQSEMDADAAINMISDQVVGTSSSQVLEDRSYRYAITSSSSVISSQELCEEIIHGEDSYLSACVVYVNGILTARAESLTYADEYLNSFADGARFFNEILTAECIVEKEEYLALTDVTELDGLLLPTRIPYTVRSGDTEQSIADAFGVSPVLLYALNLSSDFSVGSEINVVVDAPALMFIDETDTVRSRTVPASGGESKASIVEETVRSYSVLGVEYASEVVSAESKELYPDRPVAKSIQSVGSNGFCWPLDKAYAQYVSSYWGDGRGHSAVDIACRTGVPILSVKDGVVESINASGSGYGQHFVINHGNGLKTLYAHCSKMYVSVGDRVLRGEVVALVGSTGQSTGSHLHFEVILNGVKVNPCPYLGI